MIREEQEEEPCSKSELSLLSAAHHSLLTARLANLVGADPFTLDRPGAKALVVGIVASEVAVLDQTSAGVSAVEVDDFELWFQVSKQAFSPLFDLLREVVRLT